MEIETVSSMNGAISTTRIAVKRIVIEVNRTLTAEQLGLLDETLKQLGLVKATKVTLHHHEARHTKTGKNQFTVQASPNKKQHHPKTSYDFSAAF